MLLAANIVVLVASSLLWLTAVINRRYSRKELERCQRKLNEAQEERKLLEKERLKIQFWRNRRKKQERDLRRGRR